MNSFVGLGAGVASIGSDLPAPRPDGVSVLSVRHRPYSDLENTTGRKRAEMANMRELVGITDGYWYFCREERNLAAILYHLLLCRDNLQRFCDAVGYRSRLADPAVYFEYALCS